jgi:GDSL-like Lipase/Acylhydrolase family
MTRLRGRILLLLVGCGVAALVGEGTYRLFRRTGEAYEMYFRDADRKPYWPKHDPQSRAVEFFVKIMTPLTLPAEAPMPRPQGALWKPGARFFICYTGPRQAYFDKDGGVEYRFDQFGIRDRDDLTLDKPAGVRRVVCLGDSFTLGWGVRRAHSWPVLVEEELRQQQPDVQVINCGGAGSSYADEYWYALEARPGGALGGRGYGAFQPDVVLVTLCLNDLVITNGKLCQYRTEALPYEEIPPESRRWWMHSRILADLARRRAAAHALDLDPGRDWVDELMHLPPDHLWYRLKSETRELYWVAGTPQKALVHIRDWCNARGAKAAVVVWPFLQGLGPGQFYPFTRLHQLVTAFCEKEHIPCLDLLPTLRGQEPEQLWVSPVDMHPNERAQLRVAPVLATFVADTLGRH